MDQNNNVIQFPKDAVATGVDMGVGEDQTAVTVQTVQDNNSTFDIDKARKLFGIQESLQAIDVVRKDIISRRLSVLGNEEVSQKLDEKLSAYTIEQIKNLTEDEISSIYQLEDGEMEITIDFNGDKGREFEFKRDFLIFMKESSAAMEEIDKEVERLEKMLEENQEEFNKLVAEFGNLSGYIQATLQEKYETATGEEKEKIGTMLKAYEHALTLENIYEHYTKFSTENTISDLYHRADAVYAKYTDVRKQLKVRTDIAQFDNLELKFLEEKYHKHPNILLFAIMKYIAYKKDKANRRADGIFLAQLGLNLKSLYTNSFEDEETKEKFLQGARKVLDLFV